MDSVLTTNGVRSSLLARDEALGGKGSVFSPALVAMSLVALNAGCAMRVAAQILAYQHYTESAWSWLPVSAVIELSALTAFAANMVLTQLVSRLHTRAAWPRHAR